MEIKIKPTAAIEIDTPTGVLRGPEGKQGPQGERGPQGEPGAIKMLIVDTLPPVGASDTIYLLKKDLPEEHNLYEEYIYTNNDWEHIGDTSVDLSDYYKKEEIDKKISKIDSTAVYLPEYEMNLSEVLLALLESFNSAIDDLENRKENSDNKVQTISGSSDETQYPSAKAVYDLFNSLTPQNINSSEEVQNE